jgi:ATP-dependent exoDNAse (exonuclease V) beta subunit
LVFAAHNQCDFTELGLLARQALRQDSGPEDLAAALGARLQHLLVDEMQDTSTSQYELLERLTASWDGHSQTVFLVGDPRQSIYLFRQARVERFIRAMHSERLGDLPLTHLRLTANFRSQRALIDRFNVEFPLIFPSSTGRQPAAHDLPYGPAIATLPPSPHAAGVTWHINPVGASSQAAGPVGAFTPAQLNQQQAQQDAREIRRIAGRWLARPLPPGRRLLPDGRPEPWRIAVLVRGRSHLVEIVTALKQQEEPGPVPFRAVEIEPLTERQEVLDLTALTRALLHPGDRVAGLALLRAPWCGLALPELHALAAGDDPAFKQHSIQRLLADRAHLLPGEFRQRAAYVADVLQTAANLRARLTTAQLVERAWRTLGGDTWLNATELANARRYLQLLDAIEASNGRIDLALLNQRLEKLHAEPETLPPGTAHVELLTIHNAKGLEWDVVLVPALERKPAQGASRLLTWAEFDSPDSPDPATGRPAHIMLAPIRGRGDAAKPLNDWLRRIQNQREAAECKRLFYVACTRAREELHLFAAPELRASGTFTPNYSSLLKAAWPAAQLHFHAKVQAGTGATLPDGAQGVASRKDNQQSAREPAVLDIAAAATAAAQAPILQRLPLDFDPAARFIEARARAIPCGVPDVAGETRQFDRPEGSFAVRSFGNVVHALLEVLAARTAAGCDVKRLIVELPAWTPRIAALLRADGLPSGTVNRLTRETLAALQTTLRDPDGLWLLTAHPGAASELALTAWSEPREPTGMAGAQATSIRIDRIFEAGSEPRAASPGSGEAFLWIVDYKTTSHGPTGLEGFLTRQRAAYAPQLEAYARILAPARSTSLDRIRLALYYPAIPRLDWWKPV